MSRRTGIAAAVLLLALAAFGIWRLTGDRAAPPPAEPPTEPDVPVAPTQPRPERARPENAPAPAPEPAAPAPPERPDPSVPRVRVVAGAAADAAGIAGASVVAVRGETTLRLTADEHGVALLPGDFVGPASFWASAEDHPTIHEKADVPPAGEVRLVLSAGREVALRFVDKDGATLPLEQAGGVPEHVELVWNGAFAGDDAGMLFLTIFGVPSLWRVPIGVRADGAGLRLDRPVGPGMWRLFVGLRSGAPLLSEPFRGGDGGDGGGGGDGGEIVLELRVPDPTKARRVRVVVGDTDEAVPGARVRAMFEYGDDQAFLPGAELVADENGELMLSADAAVIGAGGQSQRPSTWWAETDTHAGVVRNLTRRDAAAEPVTMLRVYPTSVVEGEAYTAGGEPAVGALVVTFEKGRVTKTVVGEGGRYRLEGVYPKRGGRGTTIVLVEDLARGQIKAERVAVAPGETVRFVIGSPDAANEGGRLTGYLHAGEFPLAGVYVVIDPTSGQREGSFARADLEGRVTLEGIAPGAYRLKLYFGDPRVSDDHSIRSQEPVQIEPGLEETFDYDLPAGALRVRVVDAGTGRPIQGAGAVAQPARDVAKDRFPGHYYRPGWGAYTDDEGEALMLALVPGEDHEVRAFADGYERRATAGHIPGTMSEPSLVEIRLTKSE